MASVLDNVPGAAVAATDDGSPAVVAAGVSHRYGDRKALSDVSFEVAAGQIFGLLGPNGGGKTTLFRLLTTLMPLRSGRLAVHGRDVSEDPDGVRRLLGVTFQSPSLDPKLTVLENVLCHGSLYGLTGIDLRERSVAALESLGVADRRGDYAETLSGGLKRRVEIAKCLLHRPRVLVLDEPSTGLDPGARHDLWTFLDCLRRESRVTVLVTTHLMEEAERCDRLGLLNEGELIAEGTPDELRATVGGDCVTVRAEDPDAAAAEIGRRFGVSVTRLGESVRVEHDRGGDFVRDLYAELGDTVRSVTVGPPTLEDVFMRKTGHRFFEQPGD